MNQLYSKKGVEMIFVVFFHFQKLLCTIEYHPNNYIIEDLSHSWGTSLKNCLDAVFNKGLIRHLIIWKKYKNWSEKKMKKGKTWKNNNEQTKRAMGNKINKWKTMVKKRKTLGKKTEIKLFTIEAPPTNTKILN